MEKYIAILALVSPGFVVRKINEIFVSKSRSSSELEKTIISLLYGIPVLIVNLIILRGCYKIKSLEAILSYMNNLDFIFKYLEITIFSILICSIVIVFLDKRSLTILVNKIRKIFEQPMISHNQTPWEDFFEVLSEEEYNMPIEIIKDGALIARGFVNHWDLDGNGDKDLVLNYCNEFEEAKNYITKINRIYYNPKIT